MYVELKDDNGNRVVVELPKGTDSTQIFSSVVGGLMSGHSPARVLEDLIVESIASGIVFPPPENTQLNDTINIVVKDYGVDVSLKGNQYTHYV